MAAQLARACEGIRPGLHRQGACFEYSGDYDMAQTKEQSQAYYQANKERIRIYHHLWYMKNKRRINKRKRAYYQAHKAEVAEYQKRYNRLHRKRIAKYQRIYKAMHRKQSEQARERYRQRLRAAYAGAGPVA